MLYVKCLCVVPLSHICYMLYVCVCLVISYVKRLCVLSRYMLYVKCLCVVPLSQPSSSGSSVGCSVPEMKKRLKKKKCRFVACKSGKCLANQNITKNTI